MNANPLLQKATEKKRKRQKAQEDALARHQRQKDAKGKRKRTAMKRSAKSAGAKRLRVKGAIAGVGSPLAKDRRPKTGAGSRAADCPYCGGRKPPKIAGRETKHTWGQCWACKGTGVVKDAPA